VSKLTSAVRTRAQLDPGALAALGDRLSGRRRAPDLGGWELGAPDTWLDDLLARWAAHAPSVLQRRLDGLEQWSVNVGGQRVHAVRVGGVGPDPLPLVLTNGWPSSFLEHLEVASMLAEPARYGADPADAFDVVMPSLPGYGWSAPPPPGGMTAAAVADLWRNVMVDGFGYGRFAAHGSDLGAGVTGWLARRHRDVVAGIHLASPALPAPPPPWFPTEESYFAEVAAWTAEEGGYAHQHSTRPATLAAALLDSPAGLAAWIGEKVHNWSSPGPGGEPGFPMGLLLDTLTLYWCTSTIATSILPYWAYRHNPDAALPAGDPPAVPVTVTVFGGERIPFPTPPQDLAERFFRVSAWNEEQTGGHFPAVAAPARLATILRDTFRPLR